MTHEIISLIQKLNDPLCINSDIITWGSPVPSFGNLATAKVATIGLNPSNREFVNKDGKELKGQERRFHTLNSLGITKWEEVDHIHISSIADSCENYFSRNPYDGWFKRLDNIISGTSASYYFPSFEACHLDLIPFATTSKWTDLTNEQKTQLFQISGDSLARLLNNSKIQLLILNGHSVVQSFQKLSGQSFEKVEMPEWTLNRKGSNGVIGYAYKGRINKFGNIKLKNEIIVLGYNHNIQSSFGVTTTVQTAIRNWISQAAKNLFHETNR